MKISTRLAFNFSAITSLIFVIFGISVYLFSSNYRRDNFQKRLKERVIVTEKMFLEKESFSADELDKITNQFLHTLPQETEEVIELQTAIQPNYKYNYLADAKQNFLAEETTNFENQNIQGSSRKFHIGGKNYLIIVTAVDEIGYQNLSYLKKMILLLICIGIPLVFLGAFTLAKKALLPLSKKINRANNISANNLHQRLEVYNPKDEIGKLAIAFNNLLDRLEASFEAQKSFISNASHEIKNPLTAIIGETEVALNKTRSEKEYIETLKTILTEAEMLNSTTNNLLQLSKITANEEGVLFEKIHFQPFINDVKSSFDFLNVKNKITLKINAEKEIILFGNKGLLKTALINLFDNACKFSGNDFVDVIVAVTQKSFVEIRIIDKGIGIEPKDIDKIKIPFHRGNNTIKISGSGIGLALSSRIIELHNGDLNLKSEINIGTEVIVKLPLLKDS